MNNEDYTQPDARKHVDNYTSSPALSSAPTDTEMLSGVIAELESIAYLSRNTTTTRQMLRARIHKLLTSLAIADAMKEHGKP